jgi:hypothetical protein
LQELTTSTVNGVFRPKGHITVKSKLECMDVVKGTWVPFTELGEHIHDLKEIKEIQHGSKNKGSNIFGCFVQKYLSSVVV